MQLDYKPAKANISGNALSITGTVNVNVTGGSISAQAAISGQKVYLANDGINNVVLAQIDPNNNTVKAQNSGQTIRFTNDGLNNKVVISGQTVYTHGTTPKSADMITCTGASGGTQLPNLPCLRLLVRSMSGNNVMFVSGIGAQAPYSGKGVELYGGEMLPPLEIDNANELSIFAATSGQKVSIMAIA